MSKVLVLASYCGAEDGNGCTDTNPCPECLEMCNVFEADLSKADYIAQLSDLRRGDCRFAMKHGEMVPSVPNGMCGGGASDKV